MPITSSAKKALRQSVRRQAQNMRYRNKMRLLLKQVKKLASEKKVADAKALLPKLYKALDKAAKKFVILKNTAARQKSRLTKLLNKVTAASGK